jgi:hypothetical protein
MWFGKCSDLFAPQSFQIGPGLIAKAWTVSPMVQHQLIPPYVKTLLI